MSKHMGFQLLDGVEREVGHFYQSHHEDPDPNRDPQSMTLYGSGHHGNDLECEPEPEPLTVGNLVLLLVKFHHYMPLCSRL